MRFEKRPEQVDAIQWNGNGWENLLPAWIVKLEDTGIWNYHLIKDGMGMLNLYHSKNHSTSLLKYGDWLIMDPDNEKFEVIDNENFLRRFKRVGL